MPSAYNFDTGPIERSRNHVKNVPEYHPKKREQIILEGISKKMRGKNQTNAKGV